MAAMVQRQTPMRTGWLRDFSLSGGAGELRVGCQGRMALQWKLLAVPALRARYLAYVRDIAEKQLEWKTLHPLVTRWQALIADDVARDTRKLFSTEAFTTGTRGTDASLQTSIDKRGEYLLKTISAK